MSLLTLTPTDALIVVDMQNDFVFGSLAVPGAHAMLPKVCKLIDTFGRASREVALSACAHPVDHCSFTRFPPHCIKGTYGAQIHDQVLRSVIRGIPMPHHYAKGQEQAKDAFSAFDGTSLNRDLSLASITRVFVCGLATDYCVKATALDAAKLSYDVILVLDAIAAVDPQEGEKAIEEMLEFKFTGTSKYHGEIVAYYTADIS